MNKTLITRKLDGFDIITGFGSLSIDPMATRPVVASEIKNTDEFKAVKSAQDKRNAACILANTAGKKSKELLKTKPKDAEKFYRDRCNYLEMVKGHENEIKGALPACKAKEKELRGSMAVYFEPKAGEVAVDDSVVAELKGKMADGLVDINGNIIPDNRGVVYATKRAGKWSVVKIETLNVSVPKNATIYADLDDMQRKAVDLQIEIDSAAGLNDAEKIMAKAAAGEASLSEAAGLRSRLEISGADDPLAESQEWYNSRLAELDLIYG